MKKNIANKLLIVCAVLAIAGCKARKQIIATPIVVTNTTNLPITPPDLSAVSRKLIEIKNGQVAFNTFTGRANTQLNVNGANNDVTLNIRIKKDKIIWVSVTALLGIEVARAVITPDSIKIINKLQGLYIKKPFSYIYGYASKQVNYKTVEALLVGNAMPELLNKNADMDAANGSTTLTGSLQDLIYTLMVNPNLKVAQLHLSNQSAGQDLQVINTNFIQAVNRIMPSQINIASVIKDKKIQANLHYTKVDFDQQLEYPFNIPERYTQAQ